MDDGVFIVIDFHHYTTSLEELSGEIQHLVDGALKRNPDSSFFVHVDCLQHGDKKYRRYCTLLLKPGEATLERLHENLEIQETIKLEDPALCVGELTQDFYPLFERAKLPILKEERDGRETDGSITVLTEQ